MQVAFIGLGNMGLPLARHVLDAGLGLTVYNRTTSKAEPLLNAGAKLAQSPREAAQAAECLITMLADDYALAAVLEGKNGALAWLPRGALHISMSTISVDLSKRLAERHANAGSQYVAAPVFGRPEAAEAKKAVILVAGAPEAIRRVRPLLEAMGSSVLEVGEEPSLANTVKLAGNMLIASMLEALGESFAFARKSGLSAQRFLEIMNGAVFKSPVYENYGGMIVNERFKPPGFPLHMGLKDLRLILSAAEHARAPMPLASLMHDHTLSAIARGWGDLDWSALAKISADNAGLDAEP
jgi:3-hydroxyisobutyrate dehydrogenase-like beta-hydroxyacid dehydrogenase